MNNTETSSLSRYSGPARWESPQHSSTSVTSLAHALKPFHPKVCLNAHPQYPTFMVFKAHREWAKAAKAGDFLPRLKRVGSRP